MQKYIVELLGTLLVSFSVFSTGNFIAIGLASSVAAYLGGSISGGAFNPAITICLLISKKISSMDIIPYIIVEIIGAVIGFYLGNMAKKYFTPFLI
jgi:aquaporin Z